jgi:CysZ protein
MIHAFFTFFQSISLLFHKDIQKYVWISGVISLLIGAVLLFLVGFQVWDTYQDVMTSWGLSKGIGQKAVLLLKEVIPTLLLLFVVFAGYKTIIIIALGPILSKLSSVAEGVMFQQVHTAPLSFGTQVSRSIGISVSYTFWELALTAICMLFHLLPGVGSILSTLFIFIVQSYYSGANYFDFVLERKGFVTRQSTAWVKANKGSSLGIGAGFLLLLLIPVAGLILAPATAVIACTKLYGEQSPNS